MKDTTMATLAPLLQFLRGYEELEEVRPAAFHLKGRDFVHFHEETDGLVADVKLAKGRVRLKVDTLSEQADLIEVLEAKLGS